MSTPVTDTPVDPDDSGDPPQHTSGPMPGPPEPVIDTGPPLEPAEPLTWQAGMWYSATMTCPSPTCLNYNRVWTLPEFPAGVSVICGLSNTPVTFLTNTLLDPQPVEE